MAPGARGPLHAVDHEQVVTVIEGSLEASVDGATSAVSPGDAATIPPGATRQLGNAGGIAPRRHGPCRERPRVLAHLGPSARAGGDPGPRPGHARRPNGTPRRHQPLHDGRRHQGDVRGLARRRLPQHAPRPDLTSRSTTSAGARSRAAMVHQHGCASGAAPVTSSRPPRAASIARHDDGGRPRRRSRRCDRRLRRPLPAGDAGTRSRRLGEGGAGFASGSPLDRTPLLNVGDHSPVPTDVGQRTPVPGVRGRQLMPRVRVGGRDRGGYVRARRAEPQRRRRQRAQRRAAHRRCASPRRRRGRRGRSGGGEVRGCRRARRAARSSISLFGAGMALRWSARRAPGAERTSGRHVGTLRILPIRKSPVKIDESQFGCLSGRRVNALPLRPRHRHGTSCRVEERLTCSTSPSPT